MGIRRFDGILVTWAAELDICLHEFLWILITTHHPSSSSSSAHPFHPIPFLKFTNQPWALDSFTRSVGTYLIFLSNHTEHSTYMEYGAISPLNPSLRLGTFYHFIPSPNPSTCIHLRKRVQPLLPFIPISRYRNMLYPSIPVQPASFWVSLHFILQNTRWISNRHT